MNEQQWQFKHNIYKRILPNKLVHIHLVHSSLLSVCSWFLRNALSVFRFFFFNATFLPKTASSNQFFCFFLSYLARRCACFDRLFSLLFFDRLFFLVWFGFCFLFCFSRRFISLSSLAYFYPYNIVSHLLSSLFFLFPTLFRLIPSDYYWKSSFFLFRKTFRCTLYKGRFKHFIMVYCLICSSFYFINSKYLNPFKTITA